MNGERQPLSDEDIFGLVDVTVKQIIKSKSMPDTLVFIVEHGGREYRVGVIGRATLESVKSHGYKTGDGTIHLRIPKTYLREDGAGWINTPY